MMTDNARTSAAETRDARRQRLALRRARQRSLVPGVLKANLLDGFSFDKKGKLLKRLLTMPAQRVSRYQPHQGAREIARRLAQAARLQAPVSVALAA